MVKPNHLQTPASERGAVLVVALVILLIMTVLGVSNMQSSTLQVRMANNNQARQQAFEAAESALAKVEYQLQFNGHNAANIQGCTPNSSDCFDVNCAGGRCFNGNYAVGEFPNVCELAEPDPVPDPYWIRTDLDVWNTSSRHRTVNIDADGAIPDPKYIVEFLCYVDSSSDPDADTCAENDENCAPLYRVTALATSRDEKARVMLQTTYRVVD